jgi:ABC-type nitrate/sulfonate/bicarbonate transport system permease component
MSMRGNEDEKLDALFRAYHNACPDPEASANFMPNLWSRIDSRQKYLFSFRRMANGFATAAAALSIALGLYMSIPRSAPGSAETYIEALADANPLVAPDIVGQVPLDLNGR